MRKIDEQLQEIMKRSDKLQKTQADKKAALICGGAAAVCAVLIIIVSVMIPRLQDTFSGNGTVQYGSLIVSAPYLGYVVIGFLAFVLGIVVTILCLKLRNILHIKDQD